MTHRRPATVVPLPVPPFRVEGWAVAGSGKAHAVVRIPDGHGGWRRVFGCHAGGDVAAAVPDERAPWCWRCQKALSGTGRQRAREAT